MGGIVTPQDIAGVAIAVQPDLRELARRLPGILDFIDEQVAQRLEIRFQ